MEDNEIKKALECCSSQPQELCCNCPIDIRKIKGGCITALTTNALDLINRLQEEKKKNENIIRLADKTIATANAEIERLKRAKYIFSTVDYCADDLDKVLKENEELKSAINGFRGYDNKIKAEAYKEFAERLKEEYAQGINWFGVKEHYFVNVEDINNLVKEMVGKDNA